MEAALLLLFFVIVEFGLTIWLLARHGQYMKRIRGLEMALSGTEKNVSAAESEQVPRTDLADIVSNATPEDLEQARSVLKALGLGGENGIQQQ